MDKPTFDKPTTLSHMQHEVMVRYSIGLTTGEIATELGIAPGTVHEHLGRACAKLGAKNRRHAAILYDRLLRATA